MSATQQKRILKLYDKRLDADAFVTPEIAQILCAEVHNTGRMVGLLVDRRGRIEHVIVGESTRLYLPDIGRLRAASQRLRGLRLIVAKSASKEKSIAFVSASRQKPYELNQDFLTDLEKLQLDAVVQLEALPTGECGRLGIATLMSPISRNLGARVHHRIDRYRDVHDVQTPFLDFITELESDLQLSVKEASRTAKVKGDRDVAVLVGVYTTPRREWQPSLDEIKELARTAGVQVVDVVVQQRKELDSTTIVGKGKLEEICLGALQKGAELIIFDCDLSPSQLNAITDITDLKVLDRTMLILDIFARRATSQAGMLQVELAQLQYSLPRLAKKQTGLSRLTGGIGGQGPGETKLEIDRRRAKDKVARIEREIEKLRMQRQLRRKHRNAREVPVISIVGYTNAGKSTLLNALTGSDVYTENKLFATLDPTSRRLRFPKEREVIMTDTVGFIRDLPPNLVNAFRATLEELHDADLLLHVVDANDPNRDRQIKAVEDILHELELDDKERLVVLNKCDLLSQEESQKRAQVLDAIAVSARTRQGLAELMEQCEEILWA